MQAYPQYGVGSRPAL